MKKVIFVCLLSLSMCFSLPSQPLEAGPQPSPALTSAITTKPTAVETKPAESKPDHALAAATDATAKAQAPEVAVTGTQNATATNNTPAVTVSNETSIKANATKPTEKNSTESKPNADSVTTIKPVPVDPSKEKNETKPTVPANNTTNADSKDGKKNDTTTPKGDNVSPTVAPVEAKSRAFDGPSFIGGIILTLGLLAIGFMGFKYYKNQTERNYHTL